MAGYADEGSIKWSLAAAIIATPPFAYLGDRIGAYASTVSSNFILGLFDAFSGVWGAIMADPLAFSLSTNALICAGVAVCIPWVAVMLYLMYLEEGVRRRGEEHGSARWASTKELAPFRDFKNPDPADNTLLLTQNVGLAIARDGYSMDYDRNLNVLVIGGSGAGKTRYYVKPNVCQLNCDYFITDPKGDLLTDTQAMLQDAGYEVRVFNTFKCERSLVYNPLAYVKSDKDIISFAKLFISMTQGTKESAKDPFWDKSETMLYMALIAWLRDWGNPNDMHIGGLMELMNMASAKENSELDRLFFELEHGYKMVPGATDSECAQIKQHLVNGLISEKDYESFEKVKSYENYFRLNSIAEMRQNADWGIIGEDEYETFAAHPTPRNYAVLSTVVQRNKMVMEAYFAGSRPLPWDQSEGRQTGPRPGAEIADDGGGGGTERLLRWDGAEIADDGTGAGRKLVQVPSELVHNTKGIRPGYPTQGRAPGMRPSEDLSLKNYHDFKQAAGDTLKSILISCSVRLSPFTASDVKEIVCGADQMHLERFGATDPAHPKNAIFCIFEDVDQKALGFLHGIMVYQCIKTLCGIAYDQPGSKLPRCVNFLLDEYRSLNLPQDISAMISVIRSRNIAMSIILQGISQLSELYDEAAAKSIRACCDTLLFLGSSEEDTRKYVSDACGQQTVNDSNYSQSHGGQGSWSKSDSKISRALIDPAEVGKIPNSKAIVLIKGTHPALDDKYHLEEHPNYPLLGQEPTQPLPTKRELELAAAQEATDA